MEAGAAGGEEGLVVVAADASPFLSAVIFCSICFCCSCITMIDDCLVVRVRRPLLLRPAAAEGDDGVVVVAVVVVRRLLLLLLLHC